MKIENMRYIIEVSHYKSINKASKNLYVNQQQLSRIIASVEDEIGITIFERTAKGVFLTPPGKEIVKKFQQIVDTYDSIGDEPMPAQEQLHGRIHILSDVNIWSGYAGLYTAFMEEHPKIQLFTENMPSCKIVRNLINNEGIGQISRVFRGDEEEFSIPKELYYRMVSKQRVEVYGFHTNPYLCKYKTISLNTLMELPLVNYKPFPSDEKTLLERVFEPLGKPNVRYEVHNYRVFNEIVKETDCLFLTMRKPNYIYAPDLIGMPLRDNIFFENGLVRDKKHSNALYDAFEGFYTDYYEKLYEVHEDQS